MPAVKRCVDRRPHPSARWAKGLVVIALLTTSVRTTASPAPLEGEELLFGGIGGAYVGNSVDEVAATLGVTLSTSTRAVGTGCFSTSDASEGLTLMHDSRGRVHMFVVDDPSLSFDQLVIDPVYVGSSRDDVRRSFAGQEEVVVHTVPFGEGDLVVEPVRLNNARRSANLSARFAFNNRGRVNSIRLGDSAYVTAVDGCPDRRVADTRVR